MSPWGGGGRDVCRSRRRAPRRTVNPSTVMFTSTMKKTAFQMASAPGTRASTGTMARMMGTAPRSPTHPT